MSQSLIMSRFRLSLVSGSWARPSLRTSNGYVDSQALPGVFMQHNPNRGMVNSVLRPSICLMNTGNTDLRQSSTN